MGFFKYYAEGYRYEISQRSFARQPPKVSNILNTECSVVLNFCRTFTKCLIPIDVIVKRFKQTRQLVENTEVTEDQY